MAGLRSALFQNNCKTVDAITKHSATLLFLHGLGDTGYGWSMILTDSRPPHCKVICPTAPTMQVSINQGTAMPSWFDIMTLSKDDESRQDLDGVKEASQRVHEALEEIEKNGIPSNRIVLGGFSQGGALAMYSALTYHKQLAGILGLSSYIPIRRELVKECTEVNKQIPMLQCHGDCDPMVSIEIGRLTSQFLSDLNPSQYEFKVYRGLDHSMSQQEMEDVRNWLDKLLPPVGGAM